MGRQLIERMARDMKLDAVTSGAPVRRMRGHLRLELSSPMAFWWRLVASRLGTSTLPAEDEEELRRGFGIPAEVEARRTQFGEWAFEWEVR